MAKVTFEGNEYEYDERELMDYRNIKRIAKASTDMAGFFDAFAAIFCGHDEEYADMLGGSIEKMGELYAAAADNEGQTAKN